MRLIPTAVCCAVLVPVAQAACASSQTSRATPPTRVLILLKKAPVPGDCVSVTHPQRVSVRAGDAVEWEVINVSCDASVKASLDFPKVLVRFESYDYKNVPAETAAARSGGRDLTKAFGSQATGAVTGAQGMYKYNVSLSSGYVEDPDIDIWP